MDVYWILLAFVVKHFVCDYPLQMFPYMYRNKGTYGHAGGILHANIHGFGTAIVLAIFAPASPITLLSVADMVIHYHIDWSKMNFCKRYDLQPTNSDWYWFVLGLDQLLHYITYFGIVAIVKG